MQPGPDAIIGEAEPLLALLAQCVVRVDVDGEFSGSGFFVAPGEVLTCAHVVHGAEAITVTTFTGTTRPAAVISDVLLPDDPRARFYPLPDVALLCLADPPDTHPCVQLDTGEPVLTPRPDVLHLDAYTLGEHAANSVAHSGAALEFERTVVEDGWRLYKLSSGQVVGGFSGGPLLNRRTGGVCAVVDSTRSERSDLGGFGVPMPAVLAALPGLAERNAAFHAADRRWQQAQEDQNRLAAERDGGREALPLLEPVVPLHWQPGDPPSDLLRPRYGVVPFVPRGELLGQVMRWREADDRIRVLVVTGAGGQGKTRTAMEVCGQAERSGWTSGLLGAANPAGSANGLGELAGWPGRLVVAVDYAETRPELVTELLWRLYRQRGRPACRVVLIVRQARSRTELVDLFAHGEVREELTGLMRRAEVVRLGAGELELDRRELFDQALTAFATRLGVSPPRVRVDLRAPHFERPLFVLVAALLVVSDPDLDVSGLSEDELFGEILNRHEARYWDNWNTALGVGLDPEDQRLAVALAALMGATTPQDADCLVRLLPALRDAPAERTLAVTRWLRRLYGSPNGPDPAVIRPLEPDLLAEALVARVVADRPELIGQALDAGSPAQVVRLLLVLSRVASRRDAAREAARDALDKRLPALVDLLRSPDAPADELVAALRLAVPELGPILGAINCADRLPAGGPAVTALAIEIIALAIDGFRALAETDAARFLPDLAGSLTNQSSRLAQVGRPVEGLGSIEEAVTIRRALVEADAARFLPGLAASLNNQSELLARAGRPVEGLGPIEEAVTILRALVEADATRFLPDLAGSLTNQSSRLAQVGRPVEGLGPIEEAVTHYRALAQVDPTRFLPDLAMSLNNQSELLAPGRPVEGLGPIEEAVTHYSALAQADATRFLPDLATSLNNQSKRLTEVGHPDEAARRFADALDGVGRDGWSRGVLLLARARWHHSRNDLDAVLADAWQAVELLGGSGDARRHGEARALLRSIRAADAARFDQLWHAEIGAAQPVWLRLPEPDSATWELLIEWISTATWDESFTFLAAHADAVLTDSAEASLEHFIDASPGNTALTNRLALLRAARASGVEPVHTAFLEQQRIDQLIKALSSWMSTPTWEDSARFLTEHAAQLLTPEAEAVLASLSGNNPHDAVLLVHLGLLSLARHHAIHTAYALLADPEALAAAVEPTPDAAAELLAATRLDAGLHPDFAEAHLRHALAALDQGSLDEAEQAIHRCADSLASWERPAIRRRLTAVVDARPDLDVGRVIRAFDSTLSSNDHH